MERLRQPRHPSLDDLRRPQHSSRSYPQLHNGDRNGGTEPVLVEEESLLQAIGGLICAFAALMCMSGAVLLMVVLYMTVRPFSLSLYRRLAANLGGASFLDAMSLLLPNLRLYLTGDSDVPSPVGTSVLVCNHAMDADWWSILMLGRCVGLRGSLKVFLRNECLQVHPQRRSGSTNGNHSVNGSALIHRSDSTSSQLATKTVTFTRQTSGSIKNGNGNGQGRQASFPMSLTAQMLHTLLDFPVLSGENNYVEDREDLFSLLKSFAQSHGTPVHLLLFPEGWSLHETKDPKVVLAKSNEFAKREGRPQLKHLLLPRTTGFNASLESLRESSPIVYDVTLAYRGYDGSIQPAMELSFSTLWNVLRRPQEIHLRIKRYSMEEVLQDASWLDKKWAEKDRLLSQFSRHQQFPADSRGFYRHRIFNTREYAVEGSVLALLRLVIIPFFVPVLLLLSIPIFWLVLWTWIFYKSYTIVFPDSSPRTGNVGEGSGARAEQTPGSAGVDSNAGTPFFPATPFGSPSISNWRDMIGNPFQN